MTALDKRLSIMLDPDAYLHQARIMAAPSQWQALSKKARNTAIFARYGLTTTSPADLAVDPGTSILLRCWDVMPTLCLLLGTFSQRADCLSSKRYRDLDHYVRRFLALPLPHLPVPHAARGQAVDATVCGLAGIRLSLPELPEIFRQRLDLLFPPHTTAAADALAASSGMAGWFSITLLSTAASYAKSLQPRL
jgi:type III secretion system OrgA/MxiK family protein